MIGIRNKRACDRKTQRREKKDFEKTKREKYADK